MAFVADEKQTEQTNSQHSNVLAFCGRNRIYVDYEEITAENILDVIGEVVSAHVFNKAQISYLWNYYKGLQPILDRTKEVRPEINNKIVENHAQEIVAFKIGYQLAEPLQYTCRMQRDVVGEEDNQNKVNISSDKYREGNGGENKAPFNSDQKNVDAKSGKARDDYEEDSSQEDEKDKNETLNAKVDNPEKSEWANEDESAEKQKDSQDNTDLLEEKTSEVGGFSEQKDSLQDGINVDPKSSYELTLAAINELNTLMFAEDKASCDRDLFEWMCVCGVGYRMCEADTEFDENDGGAPFDIYTLDPRDTCVVYSSAYHHKQVMSVWFGKEPNTKQEVLNVYTNTMYFKIIGKVIVEQKPHTYGHNPIVEYRLNNACMGVFEPVLPLLDAINAIESNRLDGIEQTVQALMKFVNCDVSADDMKEMLALGAVKVRTVDPALKADIDVIKTELDQAGTQVTKEDLYQSIVNICGMPTRNGRGGSTSDTGAAVLLRDGWTLAESHAKSYELQIKRAEREFLRVVLNICKQSAFTDLDLRIRDIELAFNRRNYENILVKTQVLTTMLSTNKIHPQLAFSACGLFTDPDAAYKQSVEYATKNKEQFEQSPLGQMLAKGQIGNQPGAPQPPGVPANAAFASQAASPELDEKQSKKSNSVQKVPNA